jgi:hypothetical protein
MRKTVHFKINGILNMAEGQLNANRRNWLLAMGRWGIVGLIVAAVGGLCKRNGVAMSRQTCADMEGKVGCRQCVYLSDCGHPKALSAKQVLEKHG